jgi:hypothetical protein
MEENSMTDPELSSSETAAPTPAPRRQPNVTPMLENVTLLLDKRFYLKLRELMEQTKATSFSDFSGRLLMFAALQLEQQLNQQKLVQSAPTVVKADGTPYVGRRS